MTLKELWNHKPFWFGMGIFDIIFGFLVKHPILIIIGMVLVCIYRDKEEEK
jgi:hypothetical protein